MRMSSCWLLGSVVALAMSGAWANGATINFVGAVVEPTCAIDVATVATQPATPVRNACGQTATDPGRSYSREVVALHAANIADDRLLAYFASYSPRNADGRFAAQLVVRTYD